MKHWMTATAALLAITTVAPTFGQDVSEPPVVDPGHPGTRDKVGKAPSDAIVLFDGANFDAWQHVKDKAPVKWKLVDGAMEIAPKTGTIETKQKLGFGQYHIEWRTPETVKGNGQGRGNSGVFPLGGPEVQVLDSYNNKTYIDGQAGSVYKKHVTLVNACRPPGVWQTYDIIVHAPIVDDAGKVLRGSAYTVLHNGVLIQDNVLIDHKPGHTGPLRLQDHGNPVRYRNIWFRPHREALPLPGKK